MISNTKFILTFKFRDTMMKALSQVKECEMSLFDEDENESEFSKVKRKFGVLGKRYISGQGYEGMLSLE